MAGTRANLEHQDIPTVSAGNKVNTLYHSENKDKTEFPYASIIFYDGHARGVYSSRERSSYLDTRNVWEETITILP